MRHCGVRRAHVRGRSALPFTAMPPPKYTASEIERRWLADLALVGPLQALQSRVIEDHYISASHLRLRKISERAGASAGAGEGTQAKAQPGTLYKLGKKYGKGQDTDQNTQASLTEPVVSIYLTEQEFNTLSALPGTRAVKSRYAVAGGALDIYELPHAGLAIFEIEFPTESAAHSYLPPAFARHEITRDLRYSGYALTQAASAPLTPVCA